MTKNQQIFLSVLRDYVGIADNGNIMAETVWPRSKVIAVGRSLMKLNMVNYTPTQANGFEGGVWRQNESFKGRTKVNQGHRKSYSRMKKTNRHRMRHRLHGEGGKREGPETTNKAAKADYII